jgi:hypothetical protein
VTGETRLFSRIAAFGLLIGAVYWFLTYEPAGTAMLIAFGIASGVVAIAIFVGELSVRRRREAESPMERARELEPVGPTEPGPEPVAQPSIAPLVIALGLASIGFGAAFGAMLAIAGFVVTLLGARAWLANAMDETDAARRIERATERAAAKRNP